MYVANNLSKIDGDELQEATKQLWSRKAFAPEHCTPLEEYRFIESNNHGTLVRSRCSIQHV